jgi:hypothetical protein
MLEARAIPEFVSRLTSGIAELNIPYYPLLRRNVDCIIALDASADSQDLWFTRAEGKTQSPASKTSAKP